MTGVPARQWADEALKKPEAGKSAAVAAELKRAWEASGLDKESRNETLRLEAGYFERNNDAVAYAYYRDQGRSTASSEIESSHRHVVQVRVKISGAWWDPDHVDDILALRMLEANGWWDERRSQPQPKLRPGVDGGSTQRHERQNQRVTITPGFPWRARWV